MVRYGLWYFGMGVVALLIVYISHRLSTQKDSELWRTLLEEHYAELSWGKKLLEKVVIPILAGLLIVAVWPAIIVMKLKEKLFSKVDANAVEENDKPKEKEFSVGKEHLIKKLSIDEIEQRERVLDPLNAVPDLPFGHLNPAWVEFTNKLSAQDEVWSFQADWKSQWGEIEHREGYVACRGSETGAYLLTEWRVLDY